MDDGVDHRFPHGLPWHREGLDTIDAVVGNQSPRVLGVEQVKRAVHLREQVALDQILKDQFGTLEVADPDLGSHEEAMRRRMEQQRGSPFQKGTVAELESLDRVFLGVVQRFRRQPLTPDAKA